MDELHHDGVDDEHIHVVGKQTPDFRKAHLHEATIADTTDVVSAMERGAIIGSLSGLILGAIIVSTDAVGVALGAGTIVGFGIFGAAFGAWVSSLIGISIPDPGCEKYQKAVDNGKVLILADVENEQEMSIATSVRVHHPEAIVESDRDLQ